MIATASDRRRGRWRFCIADDGLVCPVRAVRLSGMCVSGYSALRLTAIRGRIGGASAQEAEGHGLISAVDTAVSRFTDRGYVRDYVWIGVDRWSASQLTTERYRPWTRVWTLVGRSLDARWTLRRTLANALRTLAAAVWCYTERLNACERLLGYSQIMEEKRVVVGEEKPLTASRTHACRDPVSEDEVNPTPDLVWLVS